MSITQYFSFGRTKTYNQTKQSLQLGGIKLAIRRKMIQRDILDLAGISALDALPRLLTFD